MKLQTFLFIVLIAGLIACNDEDDIGDDQDVNQTEISEKSTITAEISQDGSTVSMFETGEVSGPYSNGLLSFSGTTTGGSVQSISVTIATGEPEGTYPVDSITPDRGEALVTYTHADIQNGMAFKSHEGEVDVSRYEKVGEMENVKFYELDGTFDATVIEESSQQEVQVTGSFKDAFVTKPQ